ncbi:hypothetical protein PbDSM24746_30740 [Paenibacillus macerans]|nr:hypothetical protein PbDSM24746_30740 [Paenibacillus macerans]GBK69383.1 hypothetical protein PbJCM17693_30910 [Paenibacillus macerans]
MCVGTSMSAEAELKLPAFSEANAYSSFPLYILKEKAPAPCRQGGQKFEERGMTDGDFASPLAAVRQIFAPVCGAHVYFV